MKPDHGSPLWGPLQRRPGRLSGRTRLVIMVSVGFAAWGAVAGGVYLLTRMVAG